MKKILVIIFLSTTLFSGEYCQSKEDLSKYLDYYYQLMTMYNLFGEENSAKASDLLFKADYFGLLYLDCKIILENKK